MLEFKPVTKQEAPRLRRYYQTCEFGLCEYSVGTKLMWKAALHPAWAEIAGCLVVRNEIDGQVVFDYPVPGPEGDEDAALEAIENDCLERGIPPVISVVPGAGPPSCWVGIPMCGSAMCGPGGTTSITGRICSSSPGGGTPASGTTSTSSGPSGRMRSSAP